MSCMPHRSCRFIALVLALAGCGRGKSAPGLAPAPVAVTASSEEISRLWHTALSNYHHGKWGDAGKNLERLSLELPPGDSLTVEVHFRLAETYFAQGNQLQATREFRRVSDDTPNNALAPEALLRAGETWVVG